MRDVILDALDAGEVRDGYVGVPATYDTVHELRLYATALAVVFFLMFTDKDPTSPGTF